MFGECYAGMVCDELLNLGTWLLVGEILHASVSLAHEPLMYQLIHFISQNAPFATSVFGETLGNIMLVEHASRPDADIPYILSFLAEGILVLGGLTTEGIFRVPGDGDCVSEIKGWLDRGQYRLVSTVDAKPNPPSFH
jgi:hypothetical protein